MVIHTLKLHNFRCFSDLEVQFEQPLTLIKGPNGAGKTSILEALYAISYRRSFRTALTRDLANFTHLQPFTISLKGTHEAETWELFWGYSTEQSIYKLNKNLTSFSQSSLVYTPLAVTEDDMVLIKGLPAARRSFLDQTLCLLSVDYIKILRHYRKSLETRNALLLQDPDYQTYRAWSEPLWHYAELIRKHRQEIVRQFESHITQFSRQFLDQTIRIYYHIPHEGAASLDEFIAHHSWYTQEKRSQRTLWGPHLDDIGIQLSHKNAREFSSRGMHKFLLLLLKLSQALLLNKKVVFLIDDFFLDLDKERLYYLLTLFKQVSAQLIITTPLDFPALSFLTDINASYSLINLSH